MPDDHVQPDEPSPRRRREDDYDDRPRRRRRDDYEDDDDDRERFRKDDGGLNTLIPFKNPMALAGYYVAVFSLIPCAGLFLGPTALVFGYLGLKHRKKHPTAGGLAHAVVALVGGGLTSLANWGCVIFVIVMMIQNRK